MKQSQRLIKNVLAGSLCTAFGGLLQFVAVIVIARRLTVADFGLYSFMATLAFVLFRASDMGIGAILVRDLAVEPSNGSRLLSGALSLAWIVIAGFVFSVLTLAAFLPNERGRVLLVGAMGLSGMLQFPSGCYGAVLRARERNELDGAGFLIHKIFLLLFAALALRARAAIVGVVIAHLLSAALQWFFCRSLVRRHYIKPRLLIDSGTWKYLVSKSLPFGLAGTVRLLGEQADVTILVWLAGLRAAGLYSGPYRLTVGLRFIPEAIVIALFPLFSRAAASPEYPTGFQLLYERSIRMFFLLAFPVATLFFSAPETACASVLGSQYASGVGALHLLGIAVGIYVAASPFPYLLTCLGGQKFVLIASCVSTTIRVLLDIVLTPFLGFRGPCCAVLTSECLLLCFWVTGLALRGFHLHFLKILWRPWLAALVLGGVIYLVDAHSLKLVVPLYVVGFGLYMGLILKLGAFSVAELTLAREGFSFVGPLIAQWTGRVRS
jgi:O-antigen/teichoic acid export membrane protein